MRVKDAAAEYLAKAEGQFCSGEVLAAHLGVSRNAVWKAVRALQEEGYPIESRKRIGYRLVTDADLLTEDAVREYLHTRTLGQQLLVFPELDSTNVYCRKLLQKGGNCNGTVVAANCQTAGRGRQGRAFCSPAGSGLYFSLILRPRLPFRDAPLLTACAAVAVARAVDNLYGTQVRIKWVNDLFLNGKKFCGILTEGGASLESGLLEQVVIGIGINIRHTKTAFPPELCRRVTSIEEAVPDCHVKRAQLLSAVLCELEQLLPDLSQRRFLREYRSRSCLTGRTVEIEMTDGNTKKASVVGIADDCGLIIRNLNGDVETLYAGDVHIREMHA